MSEAKTVILGRLRRALDDAPTAPSLEREYRRQSRLSTPSLHTMLDDRLTDYRATVYRETLDSLPGRISSLLAEATSYVVPDGIDPAWLPSTPEKLVDSATSPLTVAALDEADAVITGSTVSCAETGTIFLTGQASEGRRAISLVPDHHICVVPEDSIVELIPEAIERVEPQAPITMISGPSATSDIELERVEGVHGPRRLDVIILANSQ